jgi:hypothetical protein
MVGLSPIPMVRLDRAETRWISAVLLHLKLTSERLEVPVGETPNWFDLDDLALAASAIRYAYDDLSRKDKVTIGRIKPDDPLNAAAEVWLDRAYTLLANVIDDPALDITRPPFSLTPDAGTPASPA